MSQCIILLPMYKCDLIKLYNGNHLTCMLNTNIHFGNRHTCATAIICLQQLWWLQSFESFGNGVGNGRTFTMVTNIINRLYGLSISWCQQSHSHMLCFNRSQYYCSFGLRSFIQVFLTPILYLRQTYLYIPSPSVCYCYELTLFSIFMWYKGPF